MHLCHCQSLPKNCQKTHDFRVLNAKSNTRSDKVLGTPSKHTGPQPLVAQELTLHPNCLILFTSCLLCSCLSFGEPKVHTYQINENKIKCRHRSQNSRFPLRIYATFTPYIFMLLYDIVQNASVIHVTSSNNFLLFCANLAL